MPQFSGTARFTVFGLNKYLALIYSLGVVLTLLPIAGSSTPFVLPKSPQVVCAFVGDVMLGRGVAQALDGEWSKAFEHVRERIIAADVAVANLESPLTTQPYQRAGYDLRAPLEAVTALINAGFDVVSLANNHAFDAGEKGLEEVLSVLRAAGIAALTHRNAELQLWNEPSLRLLALDDSTVPLDVTAACQAVASAAARSDGVVVTIHWGGEYQPLPGGRQRAVARALAEAGADLIVGHGPHTLQPLEWLGDTLVAYSLGNFLFDQAWPRDCRWGAILFVTFGEDGIESYDVIPTVSERGRVYPAKPQDRAMIVRRLGLGETE